MFDKFLIYDPEGAANYFQNLRNIAAARQSEALVAKTSLLESQGFVGQAEIKQAYDYFGVNADFQASTPDQQLLDLYQARVPDLGQEEKARAKRELSKIAQARNSDLLKNVTSDGKSSILKTSILASVAVSHPPTMLLERGDYWPLPMKADVDHDTDRLVAEMQTYDQALAYLGGNKDVDDNFVLNLAAVKALEDDNIAPQLVRRALEIIGKERKSDVILAEARNDAKSAQMTARNAYALLDIEHPELIDDDMVLTSHNIRLEDAPARAGELNEALLVIANERNSDKLRYTVSQLSGNAVHVGSTGGWDRNERPLTEPRGLNNIGNTCYLNSLLQYLFTIKPVRDMVEHFDQYKQDLPGGSTNFEKKVADMRVDRAGVQRTQACKQLAKTYANRELTNVFY